MIRNSFILLLLAGMTWMLYQGFGGFSNRDQLNDVATYYAEEGPAEVGAANMVTSVVVTYRGLDTLGEVTILFLTAAIVGMMMAGEKNRRKESETSSALFLTASRILFPVLILVGVYVFINGHLTPGGGFQGGAILASAILLGLLAFSASPVKARVLHAIESFSGIGFVTIGLLGILWAGGFLDNAILPLGKFGTLLSAGAIPIIYSLVGLKVGSELSVIVLNLKGSEEGDHHE